MARQLVEQVPWLEHSEAWDEVFTAHHADSPDPGFVPDPNSPRPMSFAAVSTLDLHGVKIFVDDDEPDVRQAGFQMHISKSVEVAELLAVVASLAGRTGP